MQNIENTNFHDRYTVTNLESYCAHRFYQKHLGELYCGRNAEDFEKEKEAIADELNNSILEINSEKTALILELKRELSDYNKRIRSQKAKLLPLQENVVGNRVINESDLEMLKKFFPEIDLKHLEEIQK